MDQIVQQLQNLNVNPPSTNWFNLPFEMREMVIDRMDPKTRCRFAQCSKLCEEEAKGSRNYLYGINVSSSGVVEKILSSFHPFDLQIYHHREKPDYTIKFIENGTQDTTVVYETSTNQENIERIVKWTKEEIGNPSEVRSKYFKEYVEKYERSIKLLNIFNDAFSLVDHNVRNLKHLEDINITYCFVDVIQCGFLTKNQVMNAKSVDLADTNFTFEEVLQFEGLFYTIKSDDFDEEHIVKYLEMWKTGKVSKNLKNLLFYKKPERVDSGRLMEGLDAFGFNGDHDSFEFFFYADHHRKDQLRTAVEYTPQFFAICIDN